MKRDFSYGVIPIFRKGNKNKFLIILHSMGHWGFPKGHKKKDESDIEAAKRELSEETGIQEVEVDESMKFLENYTYMQNDILLNKTVTFFPGSVKNLIVEVDQKEVVDFKWVGLEEALEILSFDNQKRLLNEVANWLQKR